MVNLLANVIHAAEDGRLDVTATLASLTTARRLAAELERSELALIAAARDGGATWSQIAVAMGTRNRQTAQKRHADLNRRFQRPPSGLRPPGKGMDVASHALYCLRCHIHALPRGEGEPDVRAPVVRRELAAGGGMSWGRAAE
jgi:hypothetical protein